MALEHEILNRYLEVVGVKTEVKSKPKVVHRNGSRKVAEPIGNRLAGFEVDFLVAEERVAVVVIAVRMDFEHNILDVFGGGEDERTVEALTFVEADVGRQMYLCLPALGGRRSQFHVKSLAVKAHLGVEDGSPTGSIICTVDFAFSLCPEVEVAVVDVAAETVHLGLVDMECLSDGALAYAVAVAYFHVNGVVAGLAVVTRELKIARIAFAVDNPHGVYALACKREIGRVGFLVDGYHHIVGIVRSLRHIVDVDIVHLVLGAGGEGHGASKGKRSECERFDI